MPERTVKKPRRKHEILAVRLIQLYKCIHQLYATLCGIQLHNNAGKLIHPVNFYTPSSDDEAIP
ncbi:hypothetical protein D3C72_2543320 [compost metagenome]